MAWTKAKTAMITTAAVLLAAGTTTLAVRELEQRPAPAVRDKSGDLVDMRINWDNGKAYAMNVAIDQTTTTQVPGLAQPVPQNIKLTQDLDVSALKQLDNGGHQLELKFQSQSMDISQGDQSILKFDSAESAAGDTNMFAPVLRAMIGARIEFFTDAAGKVEKIEGIDELKNRIGAIADPQGKALLNQMFSEDTLEQYGSFAEAVPGRTVAVGESWRLKKDIITPIGILALDMNYTLKNWEQHGDTKCAHVDAQGTLSTKSVSGESAASGVQIDITKGTITGEFWYDPALGMIVESDNRQNLALKITMRQATMSSQFNRKVRVTFAERTP
jgi:hypothetical protein